MDITIYHNPRCGTSRNTLALLRETGAEPRVVDYLAQPPSREELRRLIAQAGLSVRQAMRAKEAVYAELGLADPSLADDQLLDAMVRLCRPVELAREIL
jgi:arsenate reductase